MGEEQDNIYLTMDVLFVCFTKLSLTRLLLDPVTSFTQHRHIDRERERERGIGRKEEKGRDGKEREDKGREGK